MKSVLTGICFVLILNLFGQNNAQEDPLLQTIQKELDKNMKYFKEQRIPAYFLSYRIENTESNSIAASSGIIETPRRNEERLLTVQMRIGNMRKDIFISVSNTTWLSLNSDFKSIAYVLRQETERAYNDAVKKYKKAKTGVFATSEAESRIDDYFAVPKQYHEKPMTCSDLNFDVPQWEEKLKNYTQEFASRKGSLESSAMVSCSTVRRYFVSSSGESIMQNSSTSRLVLNAESVTDDGMKTTLYKSYLASTPDELPDDNVIMVDLSIKKTNPTHHQPKLGGAKERKEQILTQLDATISLFLSTVQIKREQTLQQLEKLGISLEAHQSKKKNGKTKTEDKQMEQSMQRRIAYLEKKGKSYNRMEHEAVEFQNIVQSQLPGGDSLLTAAMDRQNKTNALEAEKNREEQEELKRIVEELKAKEKNAVVQEPAQNQPSSSSSTLESDIQPLPAVATTDNSSKNYQPAAGDITTGYYVVLGSFKEKINAEKFFSKLQKQYANMVAINDNSLYLVGLGPYAAREEASLRKPADMKYWILRFENSSNTRLVVF